MATIGRYIAAFLLAVPAAGIVAIAILLLVLWVSQTAGITIGVFSVAFFIGLVTFTQLFSMILDNWRDGRIVIRLITALPMSILLALAPAQMAASIGEYIMPGWENAGIVGLPILTVSSAAYALWLARSSTGRQAISRGCGLIALTAFAIPAYATGVDIVTPPVDPILPLQFFAFLFGIPVGIIFATVWWALGRQQRQEIPIGYNESRNWRG